MAKVALFLDTRREKQNPVCPLKMRISHKDDERYISLDRLKKDQWDNQNRTVKKHPNSKRASEEIKRKFLTAEAYLLKIRPLLVNIGIDELKELVEKEINRDLIDQQKQLAEILNVNLIEPKTTHRSANIGEYAQKWVDLKLKHQKRKTAIWYKDSITALLYFLNNETVVNGGKKYITKCDYKITFKKDFPITEITPAKLEEFKLHLKDELGHKPNGINARLRGISSIIGKAIQEQDANIVPRDFKNPFEFVSLPSERTKKRAVKKDCIGDIRSIKYKKHSPLWDNKNFFLFMFNMRGMNWIDLAKLRVKQIKEGRLQYIRSKNAKHFDIKLTKEAKAILSYYLFGKKPNDYVFPILPEGIEDGNEISRIADQKLRLHNRRYLKQIALDADINVNLTSYVTRHTWANTAKKMGIDTQKIQESLGHEKFETTRTYLEDFDAPELDDANERITA